MACFVCDSLVRGFHLVGLVLVAVVCADYFGVQCGVMLVVFGLVGGLAFGLLRVVVVFWGGVGVSLCWVDSCDCVSLCGFDLVVWR